MTPANTRKLETVALPVALPQGKEVEMPEKRSGFGGMLLLLAVVGFIVKFWWWIAAAIGAVVLFVALLAGAFYWARRVDEREAKRAELVARADQQHVWVCANDDRGIYGDYPPS
jgi:uncharacterized membrane protein